MLALSSAVASAALITYAEVNGFHLPAFTGPGTHTGGPLNGQTTAAISGSSYYGIENGFYGVTGSGGEVHYYPVSVGASAYFGATTAGVLAGGPLSGQALKNPNYLGASDDLRWYADSTGVSAYTELGNPTLWFDYTWSAWSGGALNGLAPAGGQGLLDFGGTNAINDLYFVNVEGDGTMEYYYMLTGAKAAFLEPTYGSWTTLAKGPLAGLTLSALQSNPTGTQNGIPYRYFGTYNNGMVFEIPDAVPEPSASLLGLAGLAIGLRRRRA